MNRPGSRGRLLRWMAIVLALSFVALSIFVIILASNLSSLQADRAKRIAASTQSNAKRDRVIQSLSTDVNNLRTQVDQCKNKGKNAAGCTVPVAPPAGTTVKAIVGPQGLPGVGVPGSPGATGAEGPGPTDTEIASAIAEYCAEHGNCTGPAGVDGKDGTNGTPGAPGNDGAPGKDGTDGAPGAPGPTCPDGYTLTAATVITSGGPVDTKICVADPAPTP